MATQVSSVRSFNGFQKVFSHVSAVLNCNMTFGVYIPDNVETEALPALVYLSGLTCTHANVMEKSGFQKYASEHRIIVIHPDTSPRGVDIEGDSDSWDFGKGAGFYVDATEEKWSKNYKMYSYITTELLDVVTSVTKFNKQKVGIFGHSMGGHGALVIGLRNPSLFQSISAFAPISNPINCPWGKKALTGYLGPNESTWTKYDASQVLKSYSGPARSVLVDQGLADNFLSQLQPEALEAASNPLVKVQVRRQPHFDHSYYFIATFMADHFAHHASVLN